MNFINKISADLKYFISGSFFTGLSSITGLIVPLLVVPFLLHKVGLKNYGISAVAFSISFFFSMIVDYGFIITGVNKLSKENDHKKVSTIITNIIYTKFFIFFLVLPIFLGIYFFTVSNQLEWKIYLFSIFIPFSSVFNLSWALQGLHQIKAWSLLTILGQICYVFFIFIGINNTFDVVYINLFYGLGVFITGIFSLFFLRKKYNLQFNKMNIKLVFVELKEGYHFFLSNIGNYIALYFLSPLTGLLLSYEMAGIYSIIEKIYVLARKPFSIYQIFMLPKIAQQIVIDKQIAKKTIKNTYALVILFMLLEIALICIFRNEILQYFTQSNLSLLVKMLLISISGIFLVLLNCPISLYLTALDKKHELMRISLIAPILGVVLGFLLIKKFDILGAIYALVFVELVYVIGLFSVYYRNESMQRT